jgi:hypothetical protein
LKAFPDTTTDKRPERPSRGVGFAALGFGAVLLAAALWLWPDDFSPGESLPPSGAQDIAVSREDTTYPNSDALRFQGRPEVVFVYLRVEDLDDASFEAWVGRSAKDSVVGRLIGDGGLRVVDRSEEPLGVSGNGVSGVLKFAVRPAAGGRLPAGNYTVEVYNVPDGSRSGSPVATKYFVVGD